jgi:DNA-binding GntR family transcriptional regulator
MGRSISAYFLIGSIIRSKILDGRFQPGEKLPSEKDLANEFGVSLITVRAALSGLETEGFIVRRAGKGTFVIENLPVSKQIIVTGNHQGLVQEFKKYPVKVLGIEIKNIGETKMGRDIEKFFGKSNNDSIGVVQRIRFVNRIPFQYLENFLSTSIVKHLNARELTQKPLQEILKEKIDLRVGYSETYIESILADPDLSKVFQVEMFSPILLFQSYVSLVSGEPFEIVNIYGNPVYFKYRIEIGHPKG